jgi:hypothetical protein
MAFDPGSRRMENQPSVAVIANLFASPRFQRLQADHRTSVLV